MSDFDLLNEYVLEDSGKIWVGPHGSARGRYARKPTVRKRD